MPIAKANISAIWRPCSVARSRSVASRGRAALLPWCCRSQDIISAGYRATQALAPRLADLRHPADVQLDIARTPEERTPVITAVKIENDSKIDDAVIRYYIRQPVGEPLDLGRLQRDMGTLYGLDYFDQVQYRVVHKGKERTLVISARAKRSGTDFLRLGLNLSDDMRGDSAFNLGASYRVNGINRLGAEWLTRVQIGDQQELYSEFYQPLDVGSRYFVAPYINAQSHHSSINSIHSQSTNTTASPQ